MSKHAIFSNQFSLNGLIEINFISHLKTEIMKNKTYSGAETASEQGQAEKWEDNSKPWRPKKGKGRFLQFKTFLPILLSRPSGRQR